MKQKIALLCGSLRRESYSRKVGAFLAEAGASFNLAIEAVDISDMPWYNEDLETAEAMPLLNLSASKYNRLMASSCHPGIQPFIAGSPEKCVGCRLASWERLEWKTCRVSLSQGGIGMAPITISANTRLPECPGHGTARSLSRRIRESRKTKTA